MFTILSTSTSSPNRVETCAHCLGEIARRVSRLSHSVTDGLQTKTFVTHHDCQAMASRIWPNGVIGFPIVQEPEGTLAIYDAEFPAVTARVREAWGSRKARPIRDDEMGEPFPAVDAP